MTQEEKNNLVEAGIDVDGAVARFVNNETLFVTYLKTFPGQEQYNNIKPNIEKKDYDEAYKAAHAIKGIAGNLGIIPVFDSVNKMLSLMKNPESADDFHANLLALNDEFDKCFNEVAKVINSLS